MEYLDFKRLIDALTARPKETEWLEFKHNFHSKEEIGERISALSNSAYLCNVPFGYIVFGIDDTTHDILGTDLHASTKLVGGEELESWLTNRLNPRIDFEIIDEFDYEDKVMYVYSKWFKRMAEAMTLPSFFCLQLQRIFAHLPYIAYFCK